MKFVFCILIIVFSTFGVQSNVFSQENKSPENKKMALTDDIHSPKKAAWMSAALPGLGQAYNKKYWKIPIIYSGFAAFGYLGVRNNNLYHKYRDAYLSRLDTSASNDLMLQYTSENLRYIKNIYWKDRDLTIILAAAFYILNIIDATVDAHLFYFDINKDLSLKIMPNLEIRDYSISSPNSNIGLSFTFNF